GGEACSSGRPRVRSSISHIKLRCAQWPSSSPSVGTVRVTPVTHHPLVPACTRTVKDLPELPGPTATAGGRPDSAGSDDALGQPKPSDARAAVPASQAYPWTSSSCARRTTQRSPDPEHPG